MIEVFTQAFSPSAYTTVFAVVDLLCAVVVPQLAYAAIVASCLSFACLAKFSSLLRRPAYHAHHVSRHLPVQVVVFHSIMAVPASVPTSTLVTLYLDVPLVVLTSQYRLALSAVLVVFIRMICPSM